MNLLEVSKTTIEPYKLPEPSEEDFNFESVE